MTACVPETYLNCGLLRFLMIIPALIVGVFSTISFSPQFISTNNVLILSSLYSRVSIALNSTNGFFSLRFYIRWNAISHIEHIIHLANIWSIIIRRLSCIYMESQIICPHEMHWRQEILQQLTHMDMGNEINEHSFWNNYSRQFHKWHIHVLTQQKGGNTSK